MAERYRWREVTPTELYNTRNDRWMPDYSHHQRHVGLAIAYSVWQYYQSTGDTDFLIRQGAELLLEVARFFADLTSYDEVADRYDIDGAMGPVLREAESRHGGGAVLKSWKETKRDIVEYKTLGK